jgi:hypothetical protein
MWCGCSRDLIVIVGLIPFCVSKGCLSSSVYCISLKIVVWFAAVTISFVLPTELKFSFVPLHFVGKLFLFFI